METRPFEAADAAALQAFLDRVPKGESAFFKEDITAPGTVERWVENSVGAHRMLAWDGDTVVGYTAVIPGVGWSSHVGEIRLIVDPQRRRAGVGHELAKRALIDALQAGMLKVVVEVVADQEAAIGLFIALGFKPEALLSNYVRSREGDLHDLLVLAHDVEDVQSVMATTGIVDELE
jgi:ribosomal protein S18 acetylase RimI-like enzyme